MRAWGLLQGLQHAGLRVTYAAPERVAWPGWDRNRLSGFEVVLFRSASELTEAIRNNNPDAIVVVNWEFLEWLPEDLHIPIVVDLIAPRLLEIQFQECLPHGFSTEMLRYVDALSRGDRFLCSTERQKAFYYSWLMMSGIDCREGIIDVVPISAAPPKKAASGRDSEMTFVYGGVSWPWQKPSRFLNQLLAVLEENKKGQLLLMSGTYPLTEVEGEGLDLGSQLKSSTHLKKQGLIPYDAMERAFRNAHLAVDLAEQSPERELSFSYRIIEYLRCGLPVICNHYLDIADRISRYQAGWVLDMEKEEDAFKSLVEELLRKPELVSERSENALRLVREEFNWEKTAAPLVRFCKNPKRAERREHLLKTLVTRSKIFEQQLFDHHDKLVSLNSQSLDLNQQLDSLRSSHHDDLDSLTRQRSPDSFTRQKRVHRRASRPCQRLLKPSSRRSMTESDGLRIPRSRPSARAFSTSITDWMKCPESRNEWSTGCYTRGWEDSSNGPSSSLSGSSGFWSSLSLPAGRHKISPSSRVRTCSQLITGLP